MGKSTSRQQAKAEIEIWEPASSTFFVNGIAYRFVANAYCAVTMTLLRRRALPSGFSGGVRASGCIG
jgi:hypothetical protein